MVTFRGPLHRGHCFSSSPPLTKRETHKSQEKKRDDSFRVVDQLNEQLKNRDAKVADLEMRLREMEAEKDRVRPPTSRHIGPSVNTRGLL